MESERDAYRVIERLDVAWIYGAYIKVSMARKDRRETFWCRKRHQTSCDVMRSVEAYVQQHWRNCLEEAQHDVLDQVSEIGIGKTPIKTARVVKESSITDKLIANKVVRESKGTIVPDSLGDVAHRLKQDLLEVTRRLDLRVIDCSKNATDVCFQKIDIL
ncbi:hypothetical protein V6N12_054858 [Hibiscus sabdariffa]|uniref:Uncharacterized protein n=1 Tax=Hibiscus sabdariffa TaxID=183260 RepID=A0ABR2D2I6_9ROSI